MSSEIQKRLQLAEAQALIRRERDTAERLAKVAHELELNPELTSAEYKARAEALRVELGRTQEFVTIRRSERRALAKAAKRTSRGG